MLESVFPAGLNFTQKLPDLSFVHNKKIFIFGFTPQWMNYFALIKTVLLHRGCTFDMAVSYTHLTLPTICSV